MSTEEQQLHAEPGPAAGSMNLDQDHSQNEEAQDTSLHIVPDSQLNPATYRFPSHRLRRRQMQEDKIPLVLVACGSFRFVLALHTLSPAP